MNTVKKLLGTCAVLAFSNAALAGPITINFQALADGAYGESAFSSLSLLADFGVDVDVSGVFGGQAAYAYLDAGKAGLGVCRTLNSAGNAKLNQKNPGSGANLCNPSSDDNVNTYNGLVEGLQFSFNENISISKIWLNNNHDPDYGLTGDTVVIGGNLYTFSAADKDAGNPQLGWIYQFAGASGDFINGQTLSIDYFLPGPNSQMTGDEFYISAIEFNRAPPDRDTNVPLPSTLALFGLGLAGMAARRRNR